MTRLRKKLDMSLGDALKPFEFLAREAFARSAESAHQYAIMGNDEYIKGLYMPVQDYLEARGFKSSGWCGIPNSDLLFMGGALDRRLVVDTIEALHADGKRIVAYYVQTRITRSALFAVKKRRGN